MLVQVKLDMWFFSWSFWVWLIFVCLHCVYIVGIIERVSILFQKKRNMGDTSNYAMYQIYSNMYIFSIQQGIWYLGGLGVCMKNIP